MKIFRTSVSLGRITVNGKTYSNVDEMPPDVRRQYEQGMRSMMADRDGDGVPDILEHPRSSGSTASVSVNKFQHITVNGKSYERLEDVPAEFRDVIAKALNNPKLSSTSAPPSRTQIRLPGIQSGSSSIGKWIILIAALLTAGGIGWLLRGGMH